MPAQEARSEVYQDIKTDMIVKTTLEEWNLIFDERCSKAADPEIRKIMIPLREEFKKKYPTIF
jgi:thymidylate synthase (FAD)